MVWNLGFISEEDFKKHVRATIMKYGVMLGVLLAGIIMMVLSVAGFGMFLK